MFSKNNQTVGGGIQTATTIMTKISEVINSLNDIKKNFGDVAVGTPELGVRDNYAWRIKVAMNDDHKVYATLESYPCDENQDKKYQRTVSEIVNRLSGIMEKHGDIPVSTPEIDPYDEDYFNWDISAKMDDDNNCEITMDFNVNKKALKEKKHEAVDLADKVWDRLNALMPVYGDKMKVSEPFTLTYPDRYLDSGEPCKVDRVVRSLRSSNLAKDTFYFGNKKGGVEIYDMSVTDLKAHIMPFLDVKEKELSDAKTRLIGVLDSARADLGNTISIKPTPVKLVGNDFFKATGVFFAPDAEGGGEYRLLGRDSTMRSSMSFALSAEINGHKEFEVGKILDTVSSINSLAKAVRYTHIDNLEQNAKKVIHDRIIMPSARSFTDDQVDTLKRYHEVAAPGTSAGVIFSQLLQEVSTEPDVARKPEKWITDTGKELDELADGITREQDQGLKR